MRREELRALIRARPFQPFTLHLPDGRTIPVLHPDFALLSPDGRTIWAYYQDYSCDMIDVALITSNHQGVPPPVPSGSNGPPTQ